MRIVRHLTGPGRGGYGWARVSDGDMLPFNTTWNLTDLKGCQTEVSGLNDVPVMELLSNHKDMDRWVVTQSEYVNVFVEYDGTRKPTPGYRFAQSFFLPDGIGRSDALRMPGLLLDKCLSLVEYQILSLSRRDVPFPAVEMDASGSVCSDTGSFRNAAEAEFALLVWKTCWLRNCEKYFDAIRLTVECDIGRTLETGLQFLAEYLNRLLPDIVKGMLSIAVGVPSRSSGAFDRNAMQILYNEANLTGKIARFDGSGLNDGYDCGLSAIEKCVAEKLQQGIWPEAYESLKSQTGETRVCADYDLLLTLAHLEDMDITFDQIEVAREALSAYSLTPSEIDGITLTAELRYVSRLSLDSVGQDDALLEKWYDRFMTASSETLAFQYLDAVARSVDGYRALIMLLDGERSGDRLIAGFNKLKGDVPQPKSAEDIEKLARHLDQYRDVEETRSFFYEVLDRYTDALIERNEASAESINRYISLANGRDERTGNIIRLLKASTTGLPGTTIDQCADRVGGSELCDTVMCHLGNDVSTSFSGEWTAWSRRVKDSRLVGFFCERLSEGSIASAEETETWKGCIEEHLGGEKACEAVIKCYNQKGGLLGEALEGLAGKSARQLIEDGKGDVVKELNGKLYRNELRILFSEYLGKCTSIETIIELSKEKVFLNGEAYDDAYTTSMNRIQGGDCPDWVTDEYLAIGLLNGEQTFRAVNALNMAIAIDSDFGTHYSTLSKVLRNRLHELAGSEFCIKAAHALMKDSGKWGLLDSDEEALRGNDGYRQQCRSEINWLGRLLRTGEWRPFEDPDEDAENDIREFLKAEAGLSEKYMNYVQTSGMKLKSLYMVAVMLAWYSGEKETLFERYITLLKSIGEECEGRMPEIISYTCKCLLSEEGRNAEESRLFNEIKKTIIKQTECNKGVVMLKKLLKIREIGNWLK